MVYRFVHSTLCRWIAEGRGRLQLWWFISFYRFRINSRVMYNPAVDNPYHVTAYPTWMEGLTLKSPTLSAVGAMGHVVTELPPVPSSWSSTTLVA